MRQTVFRPGFAFLALLLFFWLLPGIFVGLESGDESRVAGIVMESFLRREWWVPRLNGELFLEYPSFFYTWGCAIFSLFGAAEWSLKLAVVLPACGTVLLLYWAARLLHFSRAAAFWTGGILMTSAQFFSASAFGRVDMMLTFLVTLANCGALLLEDRNASLMRRTAGGVLFALATGFSILTKGPFGAVLLGAGWGCYFLLEMAVCKRFRWKLYLAFLAAGVVSLVPFLFWLWYMAGQFGQEVVYEILVTNGIMRFSGSQGDHVKAWYYYLARSPQIFCPWLLFAAGGAVLAARHFMRHRDRVSLLILAFLAPVLVVNFAAAKRMVYLLPLAPAAALAAAYFLFVICRFFRGIRTGMRRVPPYLWPVLLAAAGIAVNGGRLIQSQRHKETNSVALFWQKTAAASARENRPIVLYDPFERTRGSVVFYLRRSAPVRLTAERPSTPELWVVRCSWRDKDKRDDRHRLFRMPEEMARFKREFVPYPVRR